MVTKVPNFKDPDVTKFLIEYIRETERQDITYVRSNTANHSLLLITPDKTKVYEVTVSNAGALVVTKVSG